MAKIERVFGANVAKARRKAGLSQRELAAQMGIAHTRITEIERATRWPGNDRIEELAAALGVTVESLFAGA